jgi:hypothetical protein
VAGPSASWVPPGVVQSSVTVQHLELGVAAGEEQSLPVQVVRLLEAATVPVGAESRTVSSSPWDSPYTRATCTAG